MVKPVLIAALPLLLAHAALLATWDLARHLAVTLLLLAAAFASLLWAAARLATLPGSKRAGILLVALLLRLLLLALPPSLSDDLLRYVWDGKVVNAGQNPYLLAPEDPVLEDLRGPLWKTMPHHEVPTVYPPLALGMFSIAARFDAPLIALKTLLVACDLLTCFLLIRTAAALGLPENRVLWYAWNPLVVLEVAGMGHVDGLGVLGVVLAVFWLVKGGRRALPAALAAAGAVLAKLIPVLVLPIWARSSRRPIAFLGTAVLLISIGLAPVLVSTSGVPPGMARFAVSWEFNGPLYEPLWRLSERLGVRAWVEAKLDRAKLVSGDHELWNRFYPYNYPQLHAKLVLAVGLAVALGWVWRSRDAVAGTGAVFSTLLLFSATVYPWYLLWVLPAAALVRQRAYLLLSFLLPLSYLPEFTRVELMPWVFVAIWVPFLVALVCWSPRWSTV